MGAGYSCWRREDLLAVLEQRRREAEGHGDG
jgi:hypothetical protein